MVKMLAIWQHDKRVLGTFSLRMRKKWLFRSFRSKVRPLHSLQRPRFPIRQMNFYYRVTFTEYIWRFCATTSRDLVTLTFWPRTLTVFLIEWLAFLTHIPIFVILRLSVTELWITEFDHIFAIGYRSAYAPCHVTCYRGAKMVHIFEIPDPNLPIHFVTFRALRRRLSHVIGEK